MFRRSASILAVFAVLFATLWCCCTAVVAAPVEDAHACCEMTAGPAKASAGPNVSVAAACPPCTMLEFRKQIAVEPVKAKFTIDLLSPAIEPVTIFAFADGIRPAFIPPSDVHQQTPVAMHTCMLL